MGQGPAPCRALALRERQVRSGTALEVGDVLGLLVGVVLGARVPLLLLALALLVAAFSPPARVVGEIADDLLGLTGDLVGDRHRPLLRCRRNPAYPRSWGENGWARASYVRMATPDDHARIVAAELRVRLVERRRAQAASRDPAPIDLRSEERRVGKGGRLTRTRYE